MLINSACSILLYCAFSIKNKINCYIRETASDQVVYWHATFIFNVVMQTSQVTIAIKLTEDVHKLIADFEQKDRPDWRILNAYLKHLVLRKTNLENVMLCSVWFPEDLINMLVQ